MSARPASGVLTISIDWNADDAVLDLVAQRAMVHLGDNLAALFDTLKLPATWAVADPETSRIERFTSSPMQHEIAILGDASWMGREIPPSRVACELARRIESGRAAGYSVSTLATTSPALDHAHLAVKHGITAVRHARADKSAVSRAPRSRALHFGLWSFPVTITLPGQSRFWPGGGGARAAKASIDQAIAQRGLAQLVIESPRLAERSGAYRVLQRVLRHVAGRREAGLLEVLTIGAMAARLSSQRQGQPSRSILQSAA
jgi:hypothetical protein